MKVRIILIVVIILMSGSIYAQECNCDYTIPAAQEEIWLVNKPSHHAHQKYWPLKRKGETIICFESGLRGRLYIRDFNGGINKDGSKYVFKNCDGQIEIKAPSSDGIVFYNCQDIKLSGKGDPKLEYGIKISQTRWTGTNYGNGFGVSIQGYSEKVEIEHLEITNTGFSAITAKTDGGKYYPDGTEFILNDCSFHHNYIHDLLKGEGFYIGHNSWAINSKQHQLNGIYIYNNILKNIPWDGIQVGGTRNDSVGIAADAEIYGNTIINYGTDTNAIDPWQHNGINLSGGFSGKCFNNFIKSGKYSYKGNGIITGGVGDVHIFNNIIINPLEAGIYVTNSTAEKGKSFYLYNNTIVNPKGVGLQYKIPGTISKGYFSNNLLTFGKEMFISCASCSLEVNNNYRELFNHQNIFINCNEDDYRLRSTATSVIGKGLNLSKKPFFLITDYYNNSRNNKTAYDIGAIKF